MVGTGAVEDVLDLLVLSLSPLLVAGATVLDQTGPDGEKADSHDGFLVHDIVLVGQGVDAETGGAAEDGGLAQQAVSGERVKDALSLLLGLLGGHIARVAGSGGGESGKSSAGDGRSDERSACYKNQLVGPSASQLHANRAYYNRLYIPTALRAKREAIV